MNKSVNKMDNAAIAKLNMVRISPTKINYVAGLIRGLHVSKALVQLQFSHKAIARDVRKCLLSAIANAENNHQLNIDNLYVSEVMVGKAMVMKRFRARARGRGARILKPFSNISITLKEFQE